jgi:hypothetical protein
VECVASRPVLRIVGAVEVAGREVDGGGETGRLVEERIWEMKCCV